MRQELVAEFLYRNGIMIEKARLEKRSLSRMERNIILAGRETAAVRGLSREMINQKEMEGERDKTLVRSPMKVVAKFAFYYDGYDEVPASADYLIIESNHPLLPEGGNVSGETLGGYGIKIPSTPSFDKWVKGGRKCYRGEKS